MWNRSRTSTVICLLAAGCGKGRTVESVGPNATTPAAALALLTALAHDSLEGRLTGTPGIAKAAGIIARDMARIGLIPAGDSGHFQRVPLVMATRVVNQREIAALSLAASFAARDSFPAAKRVPGFNILGRLDGSDSSLKNEHILVGAHYDHIGVRPHPSGDSIFNGADDDASGVTAVLKIAEQLRAGPRPRRTIIFAAWTGEERGLLGARWYADHPALPLEQMALNLEVEMIGRPDSLAGGPGRAWLTGYQRSSMGPALAAAGLPIVADKRPAQNFFRRSDNYHFALKGIVAHTISSYNMHGDYHQPSDQVDRVDPVHMAAVINAAAKAVRLLADGPKPTWNPGGRPTPDSKQD